MAEVGLGQVARLELDRYDETTGAALSVYSPPDLDGLRRQQQLNATSDDERRTWEAVVPPYDVGGLWYHVWVVTGMGYGRIVHEVPVIPDRMAPAGEGVVTYATSEELANYLRDAPPADCERMLQAATREIDRMLLTARYPVDDQGMPIEAEHQRALRDAVCELVQWWDETGDAAGALDAFGSLSAGSISVGRATAGSAKGSTSRVNAQVRNILTAAGLTGHPPAEGPR
jgi:hypothetical protein